MLLIYIRTHDNFYLSKISVFLFPWFFHRSVLVDRIFDSQYLSIGLLLFQFSIYLMWKAFKCYICHTFRFHLHTEYLIITQNIRLFLLAIEWIKKMERQKMKEKTHTHKKDYRWINKYFRHSFDSNLVFLSIWEYAVHV